MCTRPLKGFILGKRENGKNNLYITSYSVHHIEVMPNHNIIKCYDSSVCFSNRPIHEFIEIPCGKCLECKLNYSRMWADRCMLEAQQYDKNCFITLTYDDLNLPQIESINSNTGEIVKAKTLVKKDLQLFWKRLRKVGIEFRYYACGEYGGKTMRPHYHAIIFGWCPDDLVPIGSNIMNNKYYDSEFLRNVWKKGFVTVGEMSWNSASYVARYTSKKVMKDGMYIDEFLPGVEREFVVMSRKPGIGAKWFDEHNVCYSTFLHQYISTENGSKSIGAIRYFDNKLAEIDDKLLQELKEKRKEFSEEKKKIMLEETSLPYLESLKVREKNLQEKTKSILRKEI